MKYQVVELSVRRYLGVYTNKTSWEHVRHAIGIVKDNEVYDFKTLEKYNIIERNEQGVLNVLTKELVVGQTYAIKDAPMIFTQEDKKYTEILIELGIEKSSFYSDDYKKMKRKKL